MTDSGVSSMTVSLALRCNIRISEKNRIKTLKKAEEPGYTPDPILAALKNSRNQSVQATIA